MYTILFENNIGGDDHHFQYKRGNVRALFYKLSATISFQILSISACIRLLCNRSGTGVENTFAFRSPPPTRKNHIELG